MEVSKIRTRMQDSTPFFPNMLNNGAVEVCLKEDVDKVISEKDKEIAELKQKLEDVNELIKTARQMLEDEKATHYAKSVDAGMENRKLKRALWLAMAERASDKARIFYFAETCGVKLNIDGYSNKEKGHTRMCTARWWRLTWLKVERKCRAKAEEYGEGK